VRTWLWIIFAAGFPWLVATWAFEQILARRGPSAFDNPGGWRLPLGEVVLLGSALTALALVALIDRMVNL
jgi:hypothetical protein